MLIHTEKPPMGWNTWNVYLGVPDEDTLKKSADYMSKNLLSSGYEYFVIDALWYENDITGEWSFDEYGRLQPDSGKFPHGVLSFSDYVHSLGLKFGIHMMRGINTRIIDHGCKIKDTGIFVDDIIDYGSPCSWSDSWYGIKTESSYAQSWYDSIVSQFAEWKVDFIKYDDLGSPIHKEEIILIENAINKCGRDMVLSLSPGNKAKTDDAGFYAAHSTMWRITGDFWDNQMNFRRCFDKIAEWNSFIHNGGWPDSDMLPLGWICENPHESGDEPRICRFTKDEIKSLMTLFSVAKSPLFLTCNLLRNTDDFLLVQTQPDCIYLNQCGNPEILLSDCEMQIWYSKAGERDYLAVFNRSEFNEDIEVGIPEVLAGKQPINVWENKAMPVKLSDPVMKFAVPSHGVLLLKCIK